MGVLSPAGRIPAWKWQLVWLLFLATVINYMDRQTLAVLSGPIKTAFTSDQSAAALDGLFEEKPRPDTGRRHLSEYGYGQVQFAFGITYATFQIFVGLLVDRFSLRWLYAGALLLWSAAGFYTGLATTVEVLILCRIMLAVGEAFNWPCAIATIQRTLPREQRSLANGIFHSGASVGAILMPLLVMAMVADDGAGWQTVFMVVGGFGALWVVLWLGLLRGERAAAIDRPAGGAADGTAPPDPPGLSLGRLFTLRTMWMVLVVGIALNLFWHFCVIWLPRYLAVDLGLGFQGGRGQAEIPLPWGTWVLTSANAYLLIQSGFFIAADLGSLTAGYLTRRLIYAGWPVERARKAVMLGTATLCLLAIPAVRIGQPWATVPLLFLAAAGAMGGFANYFALLQEVSPRNTALVSGIGGAVSWYAVAAIQPAVGAVADRLGTFVPVFMTVACVPMLGAVVHLFWPTHQGEPT
jgi:ACS family hexuronate transporter-like MFS transporter